MNNTGEFLDSVTEWKEKRNGLVHSLMKQECDLNELKSIALEGNDIVNKLDNKVKSINNHCFKEYKEI